MFALSKLVRKKHVRQRLATAIKSIIREELPSRIRLCRPDAASISASAILNMQVLSTLDEWGQRAEEADILPRIAQARETVIKELPLFKQMFNAMGAEHVTHFCWTTSGQRCCRDDRDALRKMVLAAQSVLIPYLLQAVPEPTTVKWFSASMKIRSVVVASVAHDLLKRAWLRSFSREQAEAEEYAVADDIAAAAARADGEQDDFQVQTRQRHRKVSMFLRKEHMKEHLIAILCGIRHIEQVQINLCCLDTARKRSAMRHREERRAKRSRTQPLAPARPVVACSSRLLDMLADPLGGGAAVAGPVHMSPHVRSASLLLEMMEGAINNLV